MPDRRSLYKAPFDVERPEKASQTLLAHLDRCPYSAALYIDTKGGPQTPAMARGEAFHDFAERATNMLIEGGEPSMPSEVAKDLMQVVLEDRVDLAIPAHEQDACRAMAWNWGAATLLDLEAIVGVEVMMEAQVGSWVIRGRLDLASTIHNDGAFEDYKTSLRVEPIEEYERAMQPQVYSLLRLEGTVEGEDTPLGKGLSGVHAKQSYPRYRREEDGQLVHRYTYFDRGQVHDFKRTLEGHLAKLDHGLETGEWAAQDGTHCQICPASSRCPIPADLREIGTLGTEGDAMEVAQRISRTERELRTSKAELKAWVDQNGRVIVGDEAWDFSLTRSERADKPAIDALIEEAGRDREEFFKASQSTRFGKVKEAA